MSTAGRLEFGVSRPAGGNKAAGAFVGVDISAKPLPSVEACQQASDFLEFIEFRLIQITP